MAELEQVEVRDRHALSASLSENHRQSGSIWLVTFKKGHRDYLAYDDLVEEALAWGWIDSLPRALAAPPIPGPEYEWTSPQSDEGGGCPAKLLMAHRWEDKSSSLLPATVLAVFAMRHPLTGRRGHKVHTFAEPGFYFAGTSSITSVIDS